MFASPPCLPGDSNKRREPALDLLRGLFLVLMTVDHLDGVLSKYCYEAFGFVTAAEGFVVLSGFVSARVYGRMLAREPVRFGRAISKRVALLYAAHAILVAFVAVAIWSRERLPGSSDPYAPFARAPVEYVIKALSFRFQPYLLDVLPMYVLFVASLPWLLRALRRSRTLVCAGSLSLWAISFVLDARTWIEGSGLFVLPSWQILFVGGALLANMPEGAKRAAVGSHVVVAGSALVIALGLGWRYGYLDWGTGTAWLFHRAELGPYRLLTVLAYAALFARFRETLLVRLRSRWLELLGRHSLYVFVWHLPVVLLCKPHSFIRFSTSSLGLLHTGRLALTLDLAVTGVALASLSIPALLHTRWRSNARTVAA